MFPELTEQILKAINEEKMRERRLIERERKFKEMQRTKRNSTIFDRTNMKIEEGFFDSGTLNLQMSENFSMNTKHARTKSSIGLVNSGQGIS